ncbi:hypothetical protein [Rhizobium sp. BK251]|uniref:hypothetical protein n=1 Tax=Rhizobium sp. BK251 TaxID=2512125 RepID=UPI0010460B45|nr:hypothetical protein [Rhizobium sp. BK251]TCL70594.1 hypothetical protein EV286_107471 [Rhizobium sp. BK251]
MTRAAFRQADMERIFRAAKSQGMAVQIDIRTLVVTAIPDIHKADPVDAGAGRSRILPVGNLAPDGEENFED